MRQILLSLFLFCSFFSMSQVTVEVHPADTTVCFRDSVAFTAVVTNPNADIISYQWQKNYIDLTGPGSQDSVFAIPSVSGSSQGIYRCIVFVQGEPVDTSNDAILRMHPRMYVDTLYRYNALGCASECKGQFKVKVSGGTPPYEYHWGGGKSQDTIVFGLCKGNYTLTITDAMSCDFDTSYYVDVLKSPKVTFTIEPDTVIYKTNPTIQVAFNDTMTWHITNWIWDFSDSIKVPNLNPVTHTYNDTVKPGQIAVMLSFTDLNGCDTTITNLFTLKTAKLVIPNLFTPNGDQVNDRFAIELEDDPKRDYRDAYLGTELLVYDRWGRKIFSKVNYKSEDWDGNKDADGTYFYILRLTGQYGDEVQKGSVTILRGK